MKYYVSLGNWHYIFQAGNPMSACCKTLSRIMETKYIDMLPTVFIVSQSGFNSGIVELYNTHDILHILQLSAQVDDPPLD